MIGNISKELMEGMLDAMQVGVTVLDENDLIIGWNKHQLEIFARPKNLLGTDIRDCHSEKSMNMLERMLARFKKGGGRRVRTWTQKEFEPGAGVEQVLVDYIPLYDDDGGYMGCFEACIRVSMLTPS